MSDNKDTVSIVIPCRNEKNYIAKCIDSFMNQTYSKELYEILICDGMSNDGTRDIVKEYSKKFNNIKLLDNEGLSAPKAMNIGIKYSKADIVIIFGAHAFADENFIKNNVELLNSSEASCVGGPLETISENNKGQAIALAMSSPFGVGNALFRYSQEEQFVDTVAFGAYYKKVLDDVGYFDEELVRNQDDEINLRVTEKGYKILLSPKVKSSYYSRGSYSKLWKQYYQYGFWKVRVIQKHGKIPSLRHIIPSLFVAGNVVGVLLSFFSKIVMMLWLTVLMIYLVGDFIFAIKLSKKEKNLLKYIIPVFPILHLAYGLGFIEGFINFYILKSKNKLDRNTKMSR